MIESGSPMPTANYLYKYESDVSEAVTTNIRTTLLVHYLTLKGINK